MIIYLAGVYSRPNIFLNLDAGPKKTYEEIAALSEEEMKLYMAGPHYFGGDRFQSVTDQLPDLSEEEMKVYLATPHTYEDAPKESMNIYLAGVEAGVVDPTVYDPEGTFQVPNSVIIEQKG